MGTLLVFAVDLVECEDAAPDGYWPICPRLPARLEWLLAAVLRLCPRFFTRFTTLWCPSMLAALEELKAELRSLRRSSSLAAARRLTVGCKESFPECNRGLPRLFWCCRFTYEEF